MKCLFINGWSAPGPLWDGFFEEIDKFDSHRVLNIDQIKSAGDWCEVIEGIVDEDTFVIGWSLGGMLALYFASRTRHLFKGVMTLMASPSFVSTNKDKQPNFGMSQEKYSNFYSILKAGDVNRTLSTFQFLLAEGEPHQRKVLKDLREVYLNSHERGSPVNPSVFIQSLQLLGGLDLTNDLRKIQVPCAMYFANHDALVPVPEEEDLRSLFEDTNAPELYVSKYGGHVPVFCQRSVVLSKLREFVHRLEEHIE